ncbi:MAG: glycosyltransferase family 2 protein [Patescibacteria group bacterium]
MTTICLSMIVRNEAKVIKRCLASVKRHIDSYAIVDTGSTDGTQDIIRAELSGIPGYIIDRPWEDFATNRNQALQLAMTIGADFAMVIDADEELRWPEKADMRSVLTKPIYGISLRLTGSSQTWTRTLLLRLNLPWRWIGRVHESLETPGVELGPQDKVLFGNVYIASHGDGARNSGKDRRAKYARDLKVLKKMLREDKDNKARTQYYLGQTYMGLFDWDRAIDAYEKRIAMGGWFEEVYSSMTQIALIMGLRGDHWHDIARAYERAYEYRPERAEALFELCVLHRDQGNHALAEMYSRAACRIPRPSDVLLVDEDVYAWRAADELAGALARMGRKEEAQGILQRLIDLKGLPEEERARARENLAMLDEPPEGSSSQAAA